MVSSRYICVMYCVVRLSDKAEALAPIGDYYPIRDYVVPGAGPRV